MIVCKTLTDTHLVNTSTRGLAYSVLPWASLGAQHLATWLW